MQLHLPEAHLREIHEENKARLKLKKTVPLLFLNQKSVSPSFLILVGQLPDIHKEARRHIHKAPTHPSENARIPNRK